MSDSVSVCSYLVALTADRLVALVYDELSEPRAFLAPPPRRVALAPAGSLSLQAHDPFALAVFETARAPAGLFSLRHNRDFPLRALISVSEVCVLFLSLPRTER